MFMSCMDYRCNSQIITIPAAFISFNSGEALKAAMSEDERDELRKQALAELREMGIYSEDLINDILIGIQENTILRADATDSGGDSTTNKVLELPKKDKH